MPGWSLLRSYRFHRLRVTVYGHVVGWRLFTEMNASLQPNLIRCRSFIAHRGVDSGIEQSRFQVFHFISSRIHVGSWNLLDWYQHRKTKKSTPPTPIHDLTIRTATLFLQPPQRIVHNNLSWVAWAAVDRSINQSMRVLDGIIVHCWLGWRLRNGKGWLVGWFCWFAILCCQCSFEDFVANLQCWLMMNLVPSFD